MVPDLSDNGKVYLVFPFKMWGEERCDSANISDVFVLDLPADVQFLEDKDLSSVGIGDSNRCSVDFWLGKSISNLFGSKDEREQKK